MNDIASTDLAALQNRLAASERKGRIRSRLGSAALVAGLLVAAAPKAVSQGIKPAPAPTLSGLKAEIDALKNELSKEREARAALAVALSNEKSERVAMDGKLVNNIETEKGIRAQADFALTTDLNSFSSKLFTVDNDLYKVSNDVADLKTQIANLANASDLETRLAKVEGKTKYLSVVDRETYFSGTNVHIENGGGNTMSTNGLGNLIVGYNENFALVPRTGSHNVVIGANDGYSSFAGLVAGAYNIVSAPFAASFGSGNVSAGHSSFTAGRNNRADGDSSGVFGGVNNKAQAESSGVFGGSDNKATGNYSVVSGGAFLTASGNGGYNFPGN